MITAREAVSVDPAVVASRRTSSSACGHRGADDTQHVYPGKHRIIFGSPVAKLAAGRKGYRLGANRYGFNLIFVKRGLHEDRVREVSLESVLTHPRYRARLDRFEAIKDWKYETPD
jgi:hypothetical protein